jgi:hypothetical protein
LTQTTLFDRATIADGVEVYRTAPAVRGSATSQAAAVAMTPRRMSATKERILAFIRRRPDGATDEEIAEGLGLNPSTARPRRIEMAGDGLIVQAGKRKTKADNDAAVWKATAASR